MTNILQIKFNKCIKSYFLYILALFMILMMSKYSYGQYCTPGSDCTTYGDEIVEVHISNVSNTNVGCYSTSGFSLMPDTVYLKRTVTYSVNLVTGSSFNQYLGAWIDYNNDEVFDSSEVLYLNTSRESSVNFNVSIPSSTSDTSRIRFRASYDPPFNSNEACLVVLEGETKDYVVIFSDLLDDDLGVISLTAPIDGTCANDSIQVLVRIENFGKNYQINFPVKLRVYDGTTLIDSLTYNYTDTLKSLDVDNVSIGYVDLSNGGELDFVVYTGLSNDQERLNDTLIVKVDIALIPNPPIIQDEIICGHKSVTFTATSSAPTIKWYENINDVNAVDTGSSFTTPILTQTTSYFLEAISASTESAAKSAPTQTDNTTGNSWGLVFDVLNRPVTIDSVKIYSVGSSSGSMRVVLQDNTGSTITTLGPFSYPAASTTNPAIVNLHLDLDVPVGTGYRLVTANMSGGSVIRETSGNTFPYTSTSGDVEITSGYISGTSQTYYWFYDWSISYLGCKSERIEVKAIVYDDTPDFSLEDGNQFDGEFNSGTVSDPDLVCEGNTIEYELIPQGNYTTSGVGTQWYISGFSFETEFGTPPSDTSSVFPTPTNNGTLTLNATAADADSIYILTISLYNLQNLCDTTITRYIQINPKPVVDFDASNACPDENISFTDLTSITSGTLFYEWEFDDGDSSSIQNPVHSYSNPGSYTVSLKVTSNHGCTSTDTQTVIIHNLPVAGFTSSSTCFQFEFENTSFYTGGSIVDNLWYFGDGSTSNDVEPVHNYSGPGSYTVSLVVVTDKGCTDSVSQLVEISEVPVANFEFENVCGTDTPVQMTNNSTGADSYEWLLDGTPISTLENPVINFNSTGTYEVTLIAYTEDSCQHELKQTVQIYDHPQAAFSSPSVCLGEPTNFTDLSVINADSATYFWSFGDADYSSEDNPIHEYTEAGTYDVSLLLVNSNGCRDSVIQTTEVFDLPSAEFSIDKLMHTVNLTASEDHHTGYLWDFGDGNNSNDVSPEHTYTENGVYTITLIVTSDNGCESQSDESVDITSVSLEKLTQSNTINLKVYPNPFSEEAIIEYNLEKLSDVSLRVYDMQGREIAVYVNAEPQSGGTYSYILRESDQLYSSMYFVVLTVDGNVFTQKLVNNN